MAEPLARNRAAKPVLAVLRRSNVLLEGEPVRRLISSQIGTLLLEEYHKDQ